MRWEVVSGLLKMMDLLRRTKLIGIARISNIKIISNQLLAESAY